MKDHEVILVRFSRCANNRTPATVLAIALLWFFDRTCEPQRWTLSRVTWQQCLRCCDNDLHKSARWSDMAKCIPEAHLRARKSVDRGDALRFGILVGGQGALHAIYAVPGPRIHPLRYTMYGPQGHALT
jgi:hypothetical protein